MQLDVLKRVTLLSILPEHGDFITLKILRKLREALAFDEEEIARLKLQQTDGKITWDTLADTGKEIHIGDKVLSVIVAALKRLDKEKKLTNQHFDIFEMFVPAESED